MHQRRRQRLGIELPFGADLRHRDRVRDVGVAVLAHLAQMGFIGQAVGAAHQLDVAAAQVVQAGFQGGKAGSGSPGRCLRRVQGSCQGRVLIHAFTLA